MATIDGSVEKIGVRKVSHLAASESIIYSTDPTISPNTYFPSSFILLSSILPQ
jgi:hypothetical protein